MVMADDDDDNDDECSASCFFFFFCLRNRLYDGLFFQESDFFPARQASFIFTHSLSSLNCFHFFWIFFFFCRLFLDSGQRYEDQSIVQKIGANRSTNMWAKNGPTNIRAESARSCE
jgi:hypothetical protein